MLIINEVLWEEKIFDMEWKEIIISIKRRCWKINRGYKNFGYRSVINNPLMIYGKKNISIGNHVMIRDGARIEAVEKWGEVKYNPSITIGDYTKIEQNLHMTCASSVKIGEECVVLANVMITDINHCDDNIEQSVMKQRIDTKATIIGDRCFIGKNACIMPGVKLGQGVVVGANAVVTHNVPDYCVVAGVPARIIRKRDER